MLSLSNQVESSRGKSSTAVSDGYAFSISLTIATLCMHDLNQGEITQEKMLSCNIQPSTNHVNHDALGKSLLNRPDPFPVIRHDMIGFDKAADTSIPIYCPSVCKNAH